MSEMGLNRTKSSFLLAVFGCAAFVAVGVASGCRPSSEALDPGTLPENVRADYQVFARRCSKCHSLSRPLTAGITDQGHWENYVRRMRMQPASGINAEDQVVILRFLKYYSDEERKKKSDKNGESPVPSTASPATSGQVLSGPMPSSTTPSAGPSRT